MRQTQYVCDRCSVATIQDRSYWLDLVVEGTERHLCPDCKKDLYKFMRGVQVLPSDDARGFCPDCKADLGSFNSNRIKWKTSEAKK